MRADDPDETFAWPPTALFAALLQLSLPRRSLIVLSGHWRRL